MRVISYTDARSRLKELMDSVVDDMTQVVITRQKADSVVMVSLDDWNAISETLHLLSSPRNAERLHSAIRQLDSGKGKARNLAAAAKTSSA